MLKRIITCVLVSLTLAACISQPVPSKEPATDLIPDVTVPTTTDISLSQDNLSDTSAESTMVSEVSNYSIDEGFYSGIQTAIISGIALSPAKPIPESEWEDFTNRMQGLVSDSLDIEELYDVITTKLTKQGIADYLNVELYVGEGWAFRIIDGMGVPHHSVLIDETGGKIFADHSNRVPMNDEGLPDYDRFYFEKLPVLQEGELYELVISGDTPVEVIVDEFGYELGFFNPVTGEVERIDTSSIRPPQEMIVLADQLGDNFELTKIDNNWVLTENLELNIDGMAEQKLVEVFASALDGSQWLIRTVNGEERLYSSNQGYTLIPGDEIGQGFEYKAGILNESGAVEVAYTHWGKWVENTWETTADGKIDYNNAELFSGLFNINEDMVTAPDGRHIPASTLLWERTLEGLYNLQLLVKNKDFTEKYPDLDTFLKKAEEGEKFSLDILMSTSHF